MPCCPKLRRWSASRMLRALSPSPLPPKALQTGRDALLSYMRSNRWIYRGSNGFLGYQGQNECGPAAGTRCNRSGVKMARTRWWSRVRVTAKGLTRPRGRYGANRRGGPMNIEPPYGRSPHVCRHCLGPILQYDGGFICAVCDAAAEGRSRLFVAAVSKWLVQVRGEASSAVQPIPQGGPASPAATVITFGAQWVDEVLAGSMPMFMNPIDYYSLRDHIAGDIMHGRLDPTPEAISRSVRSGSARLISRRRRFHRGGSLMTSKDMQATVRNDSVLLRINLYLKRLLSYAAPFSFNSLDKAHGKRRLKALARAL